MAIEFFSPASTLENFFELPQNSHKWEECPLFIVDRHGQVVNFNPAAENLLGKELIGSDLASLLNLPSNNNPITKGLKAKNCCKGHCDLGLSEIKKQQAYIEISNVWGKGGLLGAEVKVEIVLPSAEEKRTEPAFTTW